MRCDITMVIATVLPILEAVISNSNDVESFLDDCTVDDCSR